jgi:Xaa-Pro aminopeptidase
MTLLCGACYRAGAVIRPIMRYKAIDPRMFINHRARLVKLLQPGSMAVLNSNDILPTNADGTLPLRQNADLFYLSGVDQEESILLLFPGAHDETMREILFLRETDERIAIWEGHKLTKQEAGRMSGIKRVEWVQEFPAIFHRLMGECAHVYLNTNEHRRASIAVETRDARFIRETQKKYPLHDYQRLAPLMHRLRAVKSAPELELLREACAITRDAFVRVCRMVKPGVNEMHIEAEFAHEFIRRGGQFAYSPIIASGANSCVLHYVQNDRICRKGEVLLLDVAASYANYNADLTRTIPVSGRFTRRQREVYEGVLRVLRGASKSAVPGKLHRDWQKESEALIEQELLGLGLLKRADIRNQDPERPALKRYFMHGVGHPLGLDVHDVGFTTEPFQAGGVLTVEPAIYIPEEGFGIRIENDIVLGENGNTDLMADVPIEADEIEALLNRRRK